MFEIFGLDQNTWSIIGLFIDFVGVVLLGFDLIKLQLRLKDQAKDHLDEIECMASNYGGIESWAKEIEKNSRWIDSYEIEIFHIEEEVSFNTRNAVKYNKDLASCVNGLSEHLTKLMTLITQQAQGDLKSSHNSMIFSIVGLIIIAIGFGFQIIGAIPD